MLLLSVSRILPYWMHFGNPHHFVAKACFLVKELVAFQVIPPSTQDPQLPFTKCHFHWRHLSSGWSNSAIIDSGEFCTHTALLGTKQHPPHPPDPLSLKSLPPPFILGRNGSVPCSLKRGKETQVFKSYFGVPDSSKWLGNCFYWFLSN